MAEWKRSSIIVCEIIEKHGIGRVAGFDGCECGEFSIGGISASISCRKSGGGKSSIPGHDGYGTAVRVWGMDCDRTDLTSVASAITANLYDQRYAVRFCDPQDDRENRCVYCHKARSDPRAYLCDEHQRAMEYATPADYDLRDIEYSRDGDDQPIVLAGAPATPEDKP